jgi:hypothetical protein
MPKGVHRFPRVGWHLDPALVDWFRAHAQRTERSTTALVSDALSEYRDRHDTDDKPEEGKQS